MKQLRLFGWAILLFAVPLMLLSACSKSDKDKDGDPGHDGTYSGTIIGPSGQIGTWSMTVQNGNASGNFTVASQTHEFNGKVKDSKIAFQVSPEPGYVIDVELIFSGDQVLGSWKDNEGGVGGVEGTKTGGGGGGGSGGAYDGTYEGKAFEDGEVLGDWEMTVTNNQATGSYNSGGMTRNFSGNVSSSGAMNVSMNLGGGYSVTFNISISGTQVSGTWQDSDGYSGTISGTRTSQGGGGGSGNCGDPQLVGHWFVGSGNVDIKFNSDCSGFLHYKDVNNTPGCEDGSTTHFKWSTNGNKLVLNYQSMVICGDTVNTPPDDDPQTYTINGNTLQWAGTTWSK